MQQLRASTRQLLLKNDPFLMRHHLTRGTETAREVGEALFKAACNDGCQAEIEMDHALLIIPAGMDMGIGVEPGDRLAFICRQIEMDGALLIHDQTVDESEQFICAR